MVSEFPVLRLLPAFADHRFGNFLCRIQSDLVGFSVIRLSGGGNLNKLPGFMKTCVICLFLALFGVFSGSNSGLSSRN